MINQDASSWLLAKAIRLAIGVSAGAFMLPSLGLAETATATTASAADASVSTGTATNSSDSDLQEVVVTGIRASLETAQNIKRDAGVVVEAVTMEDLGKFTDVSVSDTLTRVPGVQIDRDDQGISGDRASIRGLGPSYVQVTVNGRVPLTGGSEGVDDFRQVNLDIVPTQVLSGLLVYKTPSAELVEPGLAGAIELQTLRPLDYKPPNGGNYYGSVSIDEQYDTEAKSYAPRFGAVLGTKLFDDTVGIYASAFKSDPRIRVDETFARFETDNLSFDPNDTGHATQVVDNVVVPSRITLQEGLGVDHRLGLTAGLQYKPNEHLDVNVDYEFMRRGDDQVQDYADLWFNGGAGGTSIYDAVALPGGFSLQNGYLTGLNTSKLYYPGSAAAVTPEYQPYPLYFINNQQSAVGGINVVYSGDGWKAKFDWGHSNSEFIQDLRAFIGQGNLNEPGLAFNGSTTIPTFTGFTNNGQPPGAVFALFENENVYRSDDNSFKLDLEFNVDPSWILKAGARYQVTNLQTDAVEYLPGLVKGIPGVPTANQAAVTAALYPGGNTNFINSSFGIPLLAQSYAAGQALFPGAIPNYGSPLATPSPSSEFNAYERTSAFYVQGDYKSELFGVPVTGNAGVRAVYTNLESGANESVTTDNYIGAQLSSTEVPVVETNSYWRFLPSANLNFHLRDDLDLRLGAGEVMSRPEYNLTAPQNSLGLTPSTGVYAGTIGETKLKPMTAWVFDITTEYYTASHGAVYGSLFYKKIKDFIVDATSNNVSIPGFTELFTVNGPVNAPGGFAEGAEVGVNQPFTFLPSPFDGFGVQANYTYVDSALDTNGIKGVSSSTSSEVLNGGFPGSSRDNVNGVFYYEKYGASVRLAYNYRSSYFENFGGTGDRTAEPTWTAAASQVDLTASYDITRHFSITFTGVNLNGSVRRDYIENINVFRSYVERPTTYIIGVRGTL
jgi:TonB-dependent receptor